MRGCDGVEIIVSLGLFVLDRLARYSRHRGKEKSICASDSSEHVEESEESSVVLYITKS